MNILIQIPAPLALPAQRLHLRVSHLLFRNMNSQQQPVLKDKILVIGVFNEQACN